MIPFAANTAAETANAALMKAPDNPKFSHFHEDVHRIQYMVAWAHRVSPPNGISIGSVFFVGLTNVTNRQTDRQTTLLRL